MGFSQTPHKFAFPYGFMNCSQTYVANRFAKQARESGEHSHNHMQDIGSYVPNATV